MAAGGWRDWAEGELVTEALFQDIQDSIAFIYASESAANTALTNKVEGTQFYDTTDDVLKIWDGSSAWVAVGGGITEADQWRITANATMGGMAVLTANWERNDSTGNGVPFGTGLSESSGAYTFPETGVYLIHITGTSQSAGEFLNRYALNVTTDNFSSSSDVCWAYANGGWQSGSTQLPQTASNFYIFDVTNTTTHKFKIKAGVLTSSTTVYLLGSTTRQHTGFTVWRIGDT